MSGRPNHPHREFLLKLYRQLKTDEDRHNFLITHGSAATIGIPPAEYPKGYPELIPCTCAKPDPHLEYLRRFTISDVRVCCSSCGRRTAWAGTEWTARKLWNAGEVYEPGDIQRLNKRGETKE